MRCACFALNNAPQTTDSLFYLTTFQKECFNNEANTKKY